MDDGLQDPQADSLKKEIEILRQTVGSSAADYSDATSDDDALHEDYGGELSQHDDAPSNAGNIRESVRMNGKLVVLLTIFRLWVTVIRYTYSIMF